MTRGLLAGVLLAVTLVACAMGGRKMAAAPTAGTPDSAVAMPDHHAAIEQLAQQIADERKRMGLGDLPALPTATCDSCPLAMATIPSSTDPACQHGTGDTCTDSCKLSDSICENASKICELAEKMAGDQWAADKCASGKASCTEAHDKCCTCQ